jgi:hypothetical protein
LSKKGINNDLALIKSCLKLINSSIKVSKSNGEDFSTSADEKLHDLVTSVDTILTKIKRNINWSAENQ